jgi:hypothetical protein
MWLCCTDELGYTGRTMDELAVTWMPPGELDRGHRPAKDHSSPSVTPRTAKGGAVIGVNVTFQYTDSFDRARVIGVAENARAMFEGMPGLRFKFFTLDESARRANNFYVWDSKEAALEFFSDELRQRVTDLYGVAPTIEFVEIAQIVDNAPGD